MTDGLGRGLGRGTFLATRETVFACVVRDHRWDRQVDERAVYLARLVQAYGIAVNDLVPLLDTDSFDNTLDVLVALGRGGDLEAIDKLRTYVGEGPRWVEVLELIAHEWPPELWDDLLPMARSRHPGDDVFWDGMPCATPVTPRPRPLRESTLEALLTSAGDGDEPALRELNRRGPQPALVPMLERLATDERRFPVAQALLLLGDQALPTARRWAASAGHPLRWTAHRVLAAHGDDTDVPALIAGLDSRPDDLCGYDELATGLARIGGDAVRTVLPRLRRLWFSPHSYERAAYLRALHTLEPDHVRVRSRLSEGLWDCEADVRQFAAEHVPLQADIVERLATLEADPMESEDVRAAARTRLAGRLRKHFAP